MWENFTNQYSVSKTLRFELKPTEATKRSLEASGVKERDKTRHEDFKEMKHALDVVHQQFIAESLAGLELDSTELEAYIAKVLDKEAKSFEINKASNPIFKRFSERFVATNEDWMKRYGLKKYFTASPESQISAVTNFKEEICKKLQITPNRLEELVSSFNQFSTYFTGYKTNRDNCYTTDGKATEVANRAIAQNLITFYKNAEKYRTCYSGSDTLVAMSRESELLFNLKSYTQYLTQAQIDAYNKVIGRLNSHINESRQLHGKDAKSKLPFFKELHKQILGQGTEVIIFETLESKEEYEALVRRLQEQLPVWLKQLGDHFQKQVKILSNPEQIYLNKKAVNTILFKTINDVEHVKGFLPKEFTKQSKSRDETVAIQNNFISIRQFLDAIDQAQTATDLPILKNHEEKPASPSGYVWQNFCADLQSVLTTAHGSVEAFSHQGTTNDKEIVKEALDDFTAVYRMYTYFELRYKNQPVTTFDANQEFYALFTDDENTIGLFGSEKENRFTHAYDLIRNWLTKKPYSLDKWKLNFDKATTLDGWANQDGGAQYCGWIIRQNKKSGEYHYFLAISQYTDFYNWNKFPEYFEDATSDFEIMVYRNFKSTSFFGSSWEGLFKKSYNSCKVSFNKADLSQKLEQLIEQEKSKYPELLQILNIADYDERVRAIAALKVPKMSFKKVDSRLLHSSIHPIKQKSQYLFEIVSKDFVTNNSSSDNLHSLYFKDALSGNSQLVLDGHAEIFFRPASIKSPTQRALKGGRLITENKRFTKDKILLHVPLSVNGIDPVFKGRQNYKFNQYTIEQIRKNNVNTVIGIDRGEKHLIYVAIVDQHGKLIEEPISLNTVNAIPYYKLLKQREGERAANRYNWQAVREIKDLKSGYIAHCVKQIVDLMLKHNAVVVLEDLNRGFKQGRSKIERSVYNQFEQALLKKLQYLVDKKAAPNALFGVQNGIQLTPPDITPKNTSSHMGYVFFVDPSYTSVVDPVSGYRPHFRMDDGIKTSDFQQLIQNGFDEIKYENNNLVFRFNWQKLAIARNSLGKANLSIKEPSKISDTPWRITANVVRTVYKRNKNNQGGNNELVNPQEKLLELFQNINIPLEGDIRESLAERKLSTEFVKTFLWCFNLINRIRNTVGEEDAIISPVYPNGFNSLADKLDGYDWNGDANGAYNIARKGAILLDKLYNSSDIKEFECKVDRSEYDSFVCITK